MSGMHFAGADRRKPGFATRAVHALLIGGLAAMLGGCDSAREVAMPAKVATDYRQRHPISIKETDHTVEIFIGGDRGGLTPSQRADVLAFARAWQREATGGVVIDLPAGTANERAAAEVLGEVKSILAAAAVPPERTVVRPYHPASPRTLATLRLNYPRMAAEAGPCGLWPHDIGPSFERDYNENTEYWNLGCSAQRNLAAMVDNPADLVQPRGEAPPYNARRTVVLDKYRKGETTASQYPAVLTQDPRLTDVGKP
ncbi:MAG: CpaD family pilus assembly protein [Xanthobacteraceae bacterium]